MARPLLNAFYCSKEWKNVRLQKMLDAGYRCEKCGGIAEEVHHKIEITESNVHNLNITLKKENLIALCKECHNKEHKRFKKSQIKFDEKGNIREY